MICNVNYVKKIAMPLPESTETRRNLRHSEQSERGGKVPEGLLLTGEGCVCRPWDGKRQVFENKTSSSSNELKLEEVEELWLLLTSFSSLRSCTSDFCLRSRCLRGLREARICCRESRQVDRRPVRVRMDGSRCRQRPLRLCEERS